MSINEAVTAIDKELQVLETKKARLASLRDALMAEDHDYVAGTSASLTFRKVNRGPGRGRPRKIEPFTGTSEASATKKTARKKRVLSPEGRQRIAAAQKARWAAKKAYKKGS